VRWAPVVAIILAGLASGCARKYVKDPEQAMRSNDLDWSIEWKPESPEPSPEPVP
jgi:hypothetical protein